MRLRSCRVETAVKNAQDKLRVLKNALGVLRAIIQHFPVGDARRFGYQQMSEGSRRIHATQEMEGS